MHTPGSPLALLAVLALLPTGCATWRATSLPLEKVDLERGYRSETVVGSRQLGDIALIVSFSGGGTRAAALAYGVLEELRDTQIEVGGKPTRLLDEIDTISSVSGGSFTSAYYGLHGDRLFEDFEQRFLKLDVERGLLLRIFSPKNLFRLMFPYFDRTSLAIDYYNEKIFDGMHFSDLEAAGGPMIEINSTDLSAGSRFTFTQSQFDLLCSDLSSLDVARAVTASSAVPVVFPAITLENRAGTCGFQKPEWMVEALASRQDAPRRFQVASEAAAYLDAKETPFVHLVDGGIADNLGVRGPLDDVIGRGGMLERLDAAGLQRPKHLAFIVVDASTKPDRSFVSLPGAPSIAALLGSVTDTQLHRYNFETLALLDESLKRFSKELSTPGHPLNPHMIVLGEYEIEDPDERAFFDGVPTALSLDDETVDRLVTLGRRLLRESHEFQNMLGELRGGKP
jgi:NTE family protein